MASQWNEQREKHLRKWVVEMAKSAVLMQRAAAWLARGAFMFTLTSHFCTAYTSIIPVATLGCPHLEEAQCTRLMFSGIALAVLGSVVALMDGKMDFGSMAKDLQVAAKEVTQLARRIDLQLQRSVTARDNVDEFQSNVANDYDQIMRNLPNLPRFVFRAGDLLNLTLVSAYVNAPDTPDNPPMGEFLSQKLDYEWRRLNSIP